jgi:hypothetical protein
MLGIYEFDYEKFKFFRSLERLQLHLPVVVSLEWVQLNIHNHFRKIGIFPAFYSIDRYPTFYQVLAESFDKDRSSYTLANSDAGKPSALDIYLVDSCDIPSIHVLTKNMTMRFPGLTSLTFCFENPCEIVSFLLTMIVLELKHNFSHQTHHRRSKKLSLYSSTCYSCNLFAGPSLLAAIMEIKIFLKTSRWLM